MATEVVGRFADRESFQSAVEALRAAGFEPSDLSVLDSHESLLAAQPDKAAWTQTLSGLVGEIKYMGPLGAAGLIVTGAALRELLEDIKATPHTETFARALEVGAVLLWVRAETKTRQAQATAALRDAGAADVHLHERPAAD
jgi:hypothetical protein